MKHPDSATSTSEAINIRMFHHKTTKKNTDEK
jgi:hypothetical protein